MGRKIRFMVWDKLDKLEAKISELRALIETKDTVLEFLKNEIDNTCYSYGYLKSALELKEKMP